MTGDAVGGAAGKFLLLTGGALQDYHNQGAVLRLITSPFPRTNLFCIDMPTLCQGRIPQINHIQLLTICRSFPKSLLFGGDLV